MYCSKCGKKLNEGDVFCSGCGTKVEVPAPIEEEISFDSVATPQDRHISAQEEAASFSMEKMNWDLDGYPSDSKRRSRDTGFDWSSVVDSRDRDSGQTTGLTATILKASFQPHLTMTAQESPMYLQQRMTCLTVSACSLRSSSPEWLPFSLMYVPTGAVIP